MLLSAILFAGYLLGSGQLIPKLGATRFTAMVMSLTALASACHFGADASFEALTTFPQEVYGLALLMALIATVLPTMLMNLGIHQLGSRQASLISAIGPVSTVILAYIFLDEQMSWVQGVGTVFVMTGVVVVSMHAKPSPRATDPEV